MCCDRLWQVHVFQVENENMNSITTQRVAFSSGVNHRVIYKIMVFQFREYLGKNALVKITLIFLGNQDEEIISLNYD